MRLLNTKELGLEEFAGDSIPLYAILSHRWGNEEITLKDIANIGAGYGAGYRKIRRACATAAKHGLQYIWVDTCCIDKTSSAELSEAINSMYRWYQDSVVCYAYLADVPSGANPECLESEWFNRGWTLQELIAPPTVIFFDQSWHEIGTKSTLRSVISRITGIPVTVLESGDVESASVAQRMSWASKRETTRVEDRAYSLMGLFGVNMPMLYGEGERAFIRLQEEIMRVSDDHSLFAWESAGSNGGLLAPSPTAFANSGGIVPLGSSTLSGIITTNNKGIHLRVNLVPIHTGCDPRIELAILPCAIQNEERKQVGIYVSAVSNSREYFTRFCSSKFTLVNPREFSKSMRTFIERNVCVRWERRITGGCSPLVKAAEQANRMAINLLLERGVNLEEKDQRGRTALSRAAELGHKRTVQLLIQSGASIDSEDRSGRTPLSWAAAMGHETVVRLLLQNRADIESKDRTHHWMPLIWAMENGHAGVVRDLLLQKSSESRDGTAGSGSLEVAAKALEPDLGAHGTPKVGIQELTCLLERVHSSVLKWLFDAVSGAGTSFGAMNEFARTVLDRAAENGLKSTPLTTLGMGKLLEFNEHDGRSVLTWAAGEGHARFIELMVVKEGADCDSKDLTGRTPLSWAAEGAHEAIIQLLLEKAVSKQRRAGTPAASAKAPVP